MSKKNGNRDENQTIGKLHADTLMLVEGLSQAEIGQTAQYAALSELIGRDVQHEAASNLASALNVLSRDYAIFFDRVRNVGVKRITDSEQLAVLPRKGRARIRNTANKTLKGLGHIPDARLSREELTEKMRVDSGLRTVKEFTKEPTVKEAPERPQAAPNADKKALDLFKKK